MKLKELNGQVSTEQLTRELASAAEVQASFLPARLPQVAGYEFAAALASASQVGGDFYDAIQTDDGRLSLVVADVAGKGVSAALLAATVRATVRTELRYLSEPGQVLQNVNAGLYQDLSRTERFATIALVQLPTTSQLWQYANAGHATAFWLRATPLQIQPLPSITVPLGVLPEIEAANLPLDLQPNDILMLYSDGLTEVENERGKILGRAGVIDILLATHAAPAQFIVDSLVEANKRHRVHLPAADDLTLLVIKRMPDHPLAAAYLARLHWPGDLKILPEVEAELERLQPYLPPTDQFQSWLIQVQLAMTEAVSNIIRHAYADYVGGIHGLIALYPDRLEIDLFDVGTAYELQSPAPPDFDPANPPEGGYGLNIIRQVMDDVAYQQVYDGYHERRYNHWRLTRRLPE